MEELATLHVAVAVIRDQSGKVLIAKRPDHLHQGGCWEFPGGKVEAAEEVEQALHRELSEELGINVIEAQPLIVVPFTYPEHRVVLDVWEVTAFSGEPSGCEGQPVKWVSNAELDLYTFPEANYPIIRAAQLPGLYMITGKPADQPELFLQKLEAALQRGIRLVQLRAKMLTDDALRLLAEQAIALCHRYEAKLLLNGSPELLRALPQADGLQLSSDKGAAYQARPIDHEKLLGVSCHSPQQLRQAELIGADFALLSPVQATATHPDDEPLGWQRFTECVAESTIPVYALGGMDASLQDKARLCGGQGVAAISALWDASE